MLHDTQWRYVGWSSASAPRYKECGKVGTRIMIGNQSKIWLLSIMVPTILFGSYGLCYREHFYTLNNQTHFITPSSTFDAIKSKWLEGDVAIEQFHFNLRNHCCMYPYFSVNWLNQFQSLKLLQNSMEKHSSIGCMETNEKFSLLNIQWSAQ